MSDFWSAFFGDHSQYDWYQEEAGSSQQSRSQSSDEVQESGGGLWGWLFNGSDEEQEQEQPRPTPSANRSQEQETEVDRRLKSHAKIEKDPTLTKSVDANSEYYLGTLIKGSRGERERLKRSIDRKRQDPEMREIIDKRLVEIYTDNDLKAPDGDPANGLTYVNSGVIALDPAVVNKKTFAHEIGHLGGIGDEDKADEFAYKRRRFW